MALKGTSTEEKIWNRLDDEGFSDPGKGALMGNLDAESGLKANNLQNTYEKKLGYTDETYTAAVDDGSYTNFVKDSAGYGLAQWTFWSRKQALLNYSRAVSKSIGDLEMQLDFLCKELKESYVVVYSALKKATSIREASDIVLTQFERPANQSESVKEKRAEYGQKYYEKFAKKKEESNMSNSSLVNCTVKSPNHSGARTHAIDRITPHCVVGQLSAESIGGCFTSSSKQASCNYGIGKDGRVVLCVDEANRSWCSSSNANDQRAVTIECASDTTSPYAMKDAVYNKLIDLCVDICKRNGKKKLLWLGDKTKTLNYSPKSNEMVLTVHRWFANKSCPGDWLYSRLGDLASKVTAKLGGSTSGGSTSTNTGGGSTTYKTGLYKVNVSELNIRKGPGTNYGTNGSIKNKGTYTITEIKNGSWGKLKSGAGWINVSTAYCSYQGAVSGGSSTATSTGSFKVKVSISDLYIRKGPGTNYGKNGFCPKGVYTITETKSAGGYTWGKLKSGAGWIALEHTTRV